MQTPGLKKSPNDRVCWKQRHSSCRHRKTRQKVPSGGMAIISLMVTRPLADLRSCRCHSHDKAVEAAKVHASPRETNSNFENKPLGEAIRSSRLRGKKASTAISHRIVYAIHLAPRSFARNLLSTVTGGEVLNRTSISRFTAVISDLLAKRHLPFQCCVSYQGKTQR